MRDAVETCFAGGPGERGRENGVGLNHVCFAVEDVEAEVGRMREAGFATRSGILDFHPRKLVFLEGPEGVTVALSEWH